MPKRTNKSKKNRLRQEESSSRGDSETASVVSDISDGWLNNEETSLEDIIKDLMEKLAEKRLSTRLGALQKLVKFLQTKYAPHALGGRMFTLTSSLSNCLRSKSAKEASMACHVIGLLTLTADSDDSQLYDEFHKTLRAFSADHTKAPSLRAHAIRTLVFLSFLTVDDPSAFTELQKLAQTMFGAKDAEVTEAATSAWALVSSTIDSTILATKTLPSAGPQLITLLDSKDLDTKLNAGKALALLCEATLEEDTDSKQSTEFEDMMDEVAEKLADLTTTSNKSQNKKEKARQRANFREFLRTVEDGDVPQENFNVSGTEIEILGWAKCIQIREVRRWLNTGLQTHLKDNPLLGEIFKYTIQNLSAYEVREARGDQIQLSRVNSRMKKDRYEKLRLEKTYSITADDDS